MDPAARLVRGGGICPFWLFGGSPTGTTFRCGDAGGVAFGRVASVDGGVTPAQTAPSVPSPQPGVMHQTDQFSVEDWQRVLAASRGVENPPPVEVVQVVRPSELHPLWAACVEEQGFKALPEDGMGLGMEFRSEQEKTAALVSYTCQAKYPPPPEFYRPSSSEQLKRMHDFIVDVQIPCLEKAGYPPVEVWSFESFESRYRIDRYLWNPVVDAGSLTCPANFPEDVISPR
ncbi:MAG: hypothetical protein Q4F65_11310 [Propionibacteriaceae bacterium]|nr:hypothetical protein [Propionibacteriaceae bacterium]